MLNHNFFLCFKKDHHPLSRIDNKELCPKNFSLYYRELACFFKDHGIFDLSKFSTPDSQKMLKIIFTGD